MYEFAAFLNAPYSGSQVMGLIDSVVSCQELCDSIVAEAESVINGRLANSVTQTPDERSK